ISSRDRESQSHFRNGSQSELPRALWVRQQSFDIPACRPGVTLHKNFAVRGHSWFGESEGAFQLQFDSDNLFDAVIAEVGVFRGKSRLGIDALNICIDRLIGR